MEELLEAGLLTELAGWEELAGPDGADVPPQPAKTPEAATIAAPFMKSRRDTLFFIGIPPVSICKRPKFKLCSHNRLHNLILL